MSGWAAFIGLCDNSSAAGPGAHTLVFQMYARDADPYVRHKKNHRAGNVHLFSLKNNISLGKAGNASGFWCWLVSASTAAPRYRSL